MGNVVQLAPVSFPEREFSNYASLSYELDKYETSVSLSPEYYRFSVPGQKVRGVFLGFRSIEKRNSRNQLSCFECVLWMTDGKLYLNGGKGLVTSLREAKLSLGTPIEIELVEIKEKYHKFGVKLVGDSRNRTIG